LNKNPEKYSVTIGHAIVPGFFKKYFRIACLYIKTLSRSVTIGRAIVPGFSEKYSVTIGHAIVPGFLKNK
jgi:hypothetical protein